MPSLQTLCTQWNNEKISLFHPKFKYINQNFTSNSRVLFNTLGGFTLILSAMAFSLCSLFFTWIGYAEYLYLFRKQIHVSWNPSLHSVTYTCNCILRMTIYHWLGVYSQNYIDLINNQICYEYVGMKVTTT